MDRILGKVYMDTSSYNFVSSLGCSVKCPCFQDDFDVAQALLFVLPSIVSRGRQPTLLFRKDVSR